MEDDTRRWRYCPHSWVGRIKTVQVAVLSKAMTYTLSTIPVKIPLTFLRELEKLSTIYMEASRILTSQSND